MTRPTTSRSEADDVTDPLEVVDDAAADSPAERTTAPRWRRALPILMATGIFLALWQVVVWTGWKPDYLLPGPLTVLGELVRLASEPSFW